MAFTELTIYNCGTSLDGQICRSQVYDSKLLAQTVGHTQNY